MKSYPIRAVFLEFNANNFQKSVDFPTNTQVAFAVPKRNFKRAVDRNRIKRMMREVYRNNKISDQKMALIFIFTGNKRPDFTSLESAMLRILKQIQQNQSSAN